jgi:hypothetical protein
MNTWPNGIRRAMTQDEHKHWNANNYPGTLQICVMCNAETGRCEEDSIYIDEDSEPVCEECYAAAQEVGK